MKKEQFLEQIKQNNDEIIYLCAKHMLDKIYENDQEIDENTLKDIFANYKNYHKYLNDFAGVIYNRYGSHINTIYVQMCSYLDIDIDNKYLLDYTIVKLEKQTPDLLLSLTDADIQKQTIEHFDEKLENIEESNYYIEHKQEFENRVAKLYQNISLVKSALGIR